MCARTINPYTEQVLREYRVETLEEVRSKIAALGRAQQEWKRDINTRLEALREVKKRWGSNLTELSELMSSEMGKSISQSEAEVKKCALLLDYVIENSEELLAPEPIKTEARKSYVRFDPVGVVLLVMPWNFPAWQVMRAAIPALVAGNAVILKHASIVSGSSLKLEEILGLDVFKSVITSGAIAQSAIKYVDGVSFTGSTEVGTRIAEEAGRNLKKMVLELGGSDPFIVLENANLEEAVKNCVFARLQNNGQSCIASKRFIVHEKVYNDFYMGMKEGFSKVKIGDPLDKTTFLGPLSSREQKETVVQQVKRLRSMGQVEQLATGLKGNFEPPTIVKTDALFDEEVFGPVAVLKKFKTYEEAIRIANETPFGLGVSIWGEPEEAEKLVPNIEAGMVFVNKIVVSDPRLPFGGVKKSGIGYELSSYGMLEFTHKRTVWVN
ncbi:MAG TPA: aldehyde dehydrogenase family protein [Candidatus Bathyarchaeia archaeon]|nr:aldehyde dehydrogenase family protein [Candidatus Bathyarchaeia archaeon]